VKVSARAVEGAGDVSVRGDDLSQLVALDQTTDALELIEESLPSAKGETPTLLSLNTVTDGESASGSVSRPPLVLLWVLPTPTPLLSTRSRMPSLFVSRSLPTAPVKPCTSMWVTLSEFSKKSLAKGRTKSGVTPPRTKVLRAARKNPSAGMVLPWRLMTASMTPEPWVTAPSPMTM
jgi:hypothetical protein